MMTGLLLIAHGGSDEKATGELLNYYVERLGPDHDIVKGCALSSIPETLASMDADVIYVMPLLVAEGYHTKVTIPEALAPVKGKKIVYLPPLGRSEHIVALVKERVYSARLPGF